DRPAGPVLDLPADLHDQQSPRRHVDPERPAQVQITSMLEAGDESGEHSAAQLQITPGPFARWPQGSRPQRVNRRIVSLHRGADVLKSRLAGGRMEAEQATPLSQ